MIKRIDSLDNSSQLDGVHCYRYRLWNFIHSVIVSLTRQLISFQLASCRLKRRIYLIDRKYTLRWRVTLIRSTHACVKMFTIQFCFSCLWYANSLFVYLLARRKSLSEFSQWATFCTVYSNFVLSRVRSSKFGKFLTILNELVILLKTCNKLVQNINLAIANLTLSQVLGSSIYFQERLKSNYRGGEAEVAILHTNCLPVFGHYWVFIKQDSSVHHRNGCCKTRCQ